MNWLKCVYSDTQTATPKGDIQEAMRKQLHLNGIRKGAI